MTTKTFAVAGTSKLSGTVKARFAKDMMRVKVLEKGGHEDINLVELPEPMTKADAAAHLLDTGFAKGDDAVIAALQAVIERDDRKPAAAPAAEGAEGETASSDEQDTDSQQQIAEAELDDAVVERAKEIAAEMTVPGSKPKKGKGKRTAPEPDTNSAFQQWARAADAEEAAEAAKEEEADIEF